MSAVALAKIVELAGARLENGCADTVIDGAGSISDAIAGQITFLANRKYLSLLGKTQASAVLIRESDVPKDPPSGVALLLVADPYLAWANISPLFDPAPVPRPGVHSTAIIHPTARIGSNVSIGPGVIIEEQVDIGDGVVVLAGSYIGAGSQLAGKVRIGPNVTIYHGVIIGEHTMIHAGTVIGSDGFGFAPKPDGWQRIAQIGSVIIGSHVSIGANCAIDRGAMDDTRIGNGVIIDNLVHIAHNVVIGVGTAIAAKVGIAGSTTIGKRCVFGGMVGVSGHIVICDGVHVLGMTMVQKSITHPGVYGSALPYDERRVWARNVARFRRLDELFDRVGQLEKQLPPCETGNSDD